MQDSQEEFTLILIKQLKLQKGIKQLKVKSLKILLYQTMQELRYKNEVDYEKA